MSIIRRRTIVLVHMFACVAGGIERWLITLIDGCPEFDWRVWIQERGDEDGEIVRELESRAQIFRSTEWVSASTGADVFIVSGHPNIQSFPGHTILVAHGSASFTRDLMRKFCSDADSCVAVSEKAAYAFPMERRSSVVTLWNGVDLTRCQPKCGRAEVRQKWRCFEVDTVIGFVGRIVPDKRPDLTAIAAKEIGGIPVFIGHCPDPSLMATIRAANSASIFAGTTQHVGDDYAAMDCVVMCSRFEGFGLSMVESMAAGVPLVTTRVGVLGELERRFGQLAVVVDQRPSKQDLRSAVLLALSPRNRPVVERAQEIVRECLQAEKTVIKWKQLIFSIQDNHIRETNRY